jgi:hypothetical protein
LFVLQSGHFRLGLVQKRLRIWVRTHPHPACAEEAVSAFAARLRLRFATTRSCRSQRRRRISARYDAAAAWRRPGPLPSYAGHYPRVVRMDTGAVLSAWEGRCFTVPKGRRKSNPTPQPSAVPSGLVSPAVFFPALKRRAILKMSLRDKGTCPPPFSPGKQHDSLAMFSRAFRGPGVQPGRCGTCSASDGRGRIVLRWFAYPTALEAARDGSGCSLSRQTGYRDFQISTK